MRTLPLLLIPALIVGTAEAKDGYPSSQTEKMIVDMFLLGFNAEANCRDLSFNINAIELLRQEAGLPDTTYRINGSNSRYIQDQIVNLSNKFKSDPDRACATTYSSLGPENMRPPIVTKRR